MLLSGNATILREATSGRQACGTQRDTSSLCEDVLVFQVHFPIQSAFASIHAQVFLRQIYIRFKVASVHLAAPPILFNFPVAPPPAPSYDAVSRRCKILLPRST
ncbi:hypothetical protein EVAR_35292_1 [Eumeta japonica]|uniref:Uncharacterized protein n=1 Tax=Eumeta variegata TaxID=151549 RepID=A0A4C1XK86_EUMVA|nr:hypothetical protein EVAR_35292_1 [Eumeta japonica]